MSPVIAPLTRRGNPSRYRPTTLRMLILTASLGVAAGCEEPSNPSDPRSKPEYALSVTPGALSLMPGATGFLTVRIDRTDFDGEVTLNLVGSLAGVTATLDPVSTTDDHSTLAVAVDGSTIPGEYSLPIHSTSSLGDREVQLRLVVLTPPPGFAVSVSPGYLYLNTGHAAPVQVGIPRGDYLGPVALSLAGAPDGITGLFNPTDPTGTSSTLRVQARPGIRRGIYTVAVVGSGPPGIRSATLRLFVGMVEPAPPAPSP